MRDSNKCKRCIFNKMFNVCSTCNINPLFSNQFRTTDAYYPLEIDGTHINLWRKDGTSKYTIAIFKYSASDDEWDMRLLGTSALDPRVNWLKFRELIAINYDTLKSTK